jgi:hypothetical protein
MDSLIKLSLKESLIKFNVSVIWVNYIDNICVLDSGVDTLRFIGRNYSLCSLCLKID